MDPPGMGSHAWQDTVGHSRGAAPLVLAPTLGLRLLHPDSCSLGQTRHCRRWAAAVQLQLHGGEVVKCLQGRPQCQQQKRQRRAQYLLPCASGSLYLRRVLCCHFSSGWIPGSATRLSTLLPRRDGLALLAWQRQAGGVGGWDGDRDRSCAATNLQACLQHAAVPAVPPPLWGVLCFSCILAWVPPRRLAHAHTAFTSTSHRVHTVPETLALPLPLPLSLSSHSGCHQLRRTTLHLPQRRHIQTLAPPRPPSAARGPAALPVHRGADVSPEAAGTRGTWRCRRCLSFPSRPCAAWSAPARGC